MSQRARAHAIAARRPAAPPQPKDSLLRSPWLLVGVVAAVAVVVAVFAMLGSQPQPGTAAGEDASAVYAMVAGLPQSELDAVEGGGLASPLKPIAGSPASPRPQVIYVGAQYCPYCAGERWSLVQALSRFGTFSHLSLTTSSSTDKYPDTPTFSFRGSSYSSQWVDVVALETRDREGRPLDAIPATITPLVTRFDPGQAIPFLYLDGRYTALGANYPLEVLKGLGWTDVAHALQDPSSPAARSIIGNANHLAAAICQSTGGQPGPVCKTAAVRSITLPAQ